MEVTFEFPRGTVVTDIAEPLLDVVNEHVTSRALTLDDAFAFLRDIAYFEARRIELARDYAGQTVVVENQHVHNAPNTVEAVKLAQSLTRLYYLVEIPRDGRVPDLFDAAAPPRRYRYGETDGRPRVDRLG